MWQQIPRHMRLQMMMEYESKVDLIHQPIWNILKYVKQTMILGFLVAIIYDCWDNS